MGNQANTPYNSRTAVTLFMPWIMRREITDSAEAGKQVHTSPVAYGIPTIVLSSTRGPRWAKHHRRVRWPRDSRMKSPPTFQKQIMSV